MTRALYVVTIGLSAFLFFSLQLLASRLVLPVYGGSAGVWTTALSFFTGVLFIGYAYAHLVATRLSARRGGLLHLALAGVGAGGNAARTGGGRLASRGRPGGSAGRAAGADGRGRAGRLAALGDGAARLGLVRPPIE